MLPRLDAGLGGFRAVTEAVALVPGFQNVAVVCEPVEQGGGHLRIDEHAGPLAEGQIGRDQHAGVLVELGQQMEQQSPARLTEGQIPQLIENDQVHTQEACRNPPGFALRLLLLQRVDQIDGGVKPHPLAVLRDARHADGRAQMALSRAGPAHQHDVVRGFGKGHAGELPHQRAINP